MTKRFFLASLTAVALTMGFTACDDDDDVDAGKYEMNVFLRLNQVSNDADESEQIVETYMSALGITDREDMIVAVTGKDSLDCVKTVTEKCAKAEAQLDGKQWGDLTEIAVGIDAVKNSTLLYSQTFGKASANELGNNWLTEIFRFRRRYHNNNLGRTATAMCVQSQRSEYFGWATDYPYYCDLDLNHCAGSSRIVIAMFDTEGITHLKDIQKLVQEDDHSEELNKYIADVLVLVSDSYHGDFHEFTYNGATYHYATGIYGDPVMWDLNMGAGGPYLHLFYSTDAVKFQRVIDIDQCVCAYERYTRGFVDFSLDDVGRGPWDVSEFVKAVRYNNGNVVFERDDADFNQGTGGSAWIHMRADYISFDHLKRLKFDGDGNAIMD